LLHADRVFRVVTSTGLPDFAAFEASPAFKALQEKGWVQRAHRVDGQEARSLGIHGDVAALLEHPGLPLVTFPYEWPFEALRAAALLHLRLHLELLASGFNLKDASAFNVQFDGTSPLFIDVLSVRPYREGEYWLAHNQFVRHFLAPLVLESFTAIPAQPWLRASLEGIDPVHVARILPVRARLDLRLWVHLFLPARFEAGSAKRERKPGRPTRPLPSRALTGMLRQLETLISALPAPRRPQTAWSGYADENSYAAQAEEAKGAAVRRFVAATRPQRLVDIGCNDGRYSRIAIEAGAGRVFGLDSDSAALDRAFLEARSRGLPFTPIIQDVANPSPAQGWRNEERASIFARLKVDGALALAVVHHLAIGRNIPLPEVARMLLEIAPQCLVEFVPKDDPMVTLMLSQREDVFADYGISQFLDAVREAGGEVVASEPLAGSKRTMLHVRRTAA
jgi:ribosomal protein L11 methylase PrmA